MHATIVAFTENTLQSLNRVVSVLRGRNFNILSVTPSRTKASAVSCVTIVADTSLRSSTGRVVAYLARLDEVHHAEELAPADLICRELALLKVVRTPALASAIESLLESRSVRVVDYLAGEFILEVVGTPETVEQAIQSLPYDGWSEIIRMGPIAIARTRDVHHNPPTNPAG